MILISLLVKAFIILLQIFQLNLNLIDQLKLKKIMLILMEIKIQKVYYFLLMKSLK